MITASDIQKALVLGDAMQSKLSPEALEVPGFTSLRIRHLLNNLGALPGRHYLEIGVHRGGTFISTNYKNKLLSSVAVDNWSNCANGGQSEKDFFSTCDKLLGPTAYMCYKQDSFTLRPEQFVNPINMYLYDGDHSYEAQYKALTHLYPMLADEFIFLVDDYSDSFYGAPHVKNGTQDAIRDLKLKVRFEQEMVGNGERADGWWNGFYVSLLKK